MINKVILLGRVGNEVELKTFDNGGKIANFSLATNRSYKNKQDEKIEETEWHNCTITFSKLAEVAEKYVKKGDLIYLEGRIKTRSYDHNSEKKYITEIVVESLKMLGSKTDKKQESNTSTEDDNDLPF